MSQLRADDPTALKEIVLAVQQAATARGASANSAPANSPSAEGSARFRIFVTMVTDLKNNKQRLREREDADGALGRLIKLTRKLGASGGATAVQPLNLGWDEIQFAEERGRWWIVGAAWAGRDGAAGARTGGGVRGGGGGALGGGNFSAADERLLKLAKAQHMNTDIRRRIFIAMMGAQDYVDAADRIAKLRLKKGQQPEVARVLVHVAGREKAPNPYYALLGERLCAAHREALARPHRSVVVAVSDPVFAPMCR